MGEKFKKYEKSLITSIKLPNDEILHDVHYILQDLTRDLQNNPDHGTCVDQDRTT